MKLTSERFFHRHWVDKNCIDWSRAYFKSHLIGVSGTSSAASAKISGVKTCDGDVDVCQRKGKVISLFDLNLVLTFEGRLLSSDTTEDAAAAAVGTSNGEISIPEVAYDSEESDFVFNLSAVKEDAVREVVKKQVVPQLRKLLFQFGKDLIKEHGSGIQHPVDQVKSSFTRANTIASQAEISGNGGVSDAEARALAAAKAGADGSGSGTGAGSAVPKYNVESPIKTETSFHAAAADLVQVFLDPGRVSAWSRSTAIIKPEEGFNYTLFGGNISGTILKVPSSSSTSSSSSTTPLIEMTWRLREWKEGHSANLTLNFDQKTDETTCKVTWTGIPLGQAEAVKRNFEEYYVKPIKITFGYGAVL